MGINETPSIRKSAKLAFGLAVGLMTLTLFGFRANAAQSSRAMSGTTSWSNAWASSCNGLDLADGPEDVTITPQVGYMDAYDGEFYSSAAGYFERYPYLACDHYARAQELGAKKNRVAVSDASR